MEDIQPPKQCSQLLQQTADFAALCLFITQFGPELGIHLTFPQILQLLEADESANCGHLAPLLIKLLNKLKFRARSENLELVLVRFLASYSAAVDRLLEVKDVLPTSFVPTAFTKWSELSNCTFYHSSDSVARTKVLLCLLEAQFDRNQAFKDKINLRSPVDLRYRPLGYDVWGRVYWLLKDSNFNVLLYREDNEADSFELLCQTTDELRTLHSTLKDTYQPSTALRDVFSCLFGSRGRDDVTSDDDGNAVSSAKLQVAGSPDNVAVVDDRPNGRAVIDNPDDLATVSEQLRLLPSSPSPVSPSAVLPNSSISSDLPAHITVLKKEEDIAECSATQPVDDGPMETKLTAVKQREPSPKVDEPSLAAGGAEPKNPLPSKADPPSKPKKVTRRDRRGDFDVHSKSEPMDATSTLELRRSGRQRKPVEFLTMEPIQPKRPRISLQRPPLKTENNSALQAPHTSAPELGTRKRSRKRKSKTGETHKVNNFLSKDNKQRTNKHKKRKHGRGKKKNKSIRSAWINESSSDSSDGTDDFFEQALLEHDQADSDATCEPSDHNKPSNSITLDQPESDFHLSDISDTSDADSLTQGRNLARQKRLQQTAVSGTGAARCVSPLGEQHQCQVCMQSHLPEWILLCDRCDLGHHAMCIHPPLMVIPEGDWYCPRCQHAALLVALEETADSIDADQKKQAIWRRMQERLNFVNISMTNILAENDGDELTNVTGRRRRVASNPSTRNYCSASASEDTGLSRSASDDSCSDESYSEGRYGKLRKTRQRVMPKRQKSTRASYIRRTRPSYSRYSEDDVDSSSSSVGYLEPTLRTTRQRHTDYDLKEAFKVIDEAIEEDEKYQEEKRHRQQRQNDICDGEDPMPTYVSPGHSRGKDLSNILGPEWKDDDHSRKTDRRSRLTRHLSRSDTSEGEHKGKMFGNDKRHRRDSDSDFHPAGGSSATSDSSSENVESCTQSPDSTTSDGSWLCAARRNSKLRRRSGLTRGKLRSASGGKRSCRPLPRFEADDDVIEFHRKRPQRSARVVVNYRETLDDDSDDDADVNRTNCRKRRHVHLDSDSGEEAALTQEEHFDCTNLSETAASRSSCRHILSSGSEHSPSDDHNDGEEKPDGSRTEAVELTNSHSDQPEITSNNNDDHAEMGSSSESNYSPSALVISETSPSGYQPTVSPQKNSLEAPIHPTVDDSDEDCVEGEAEDLLPIHHRSFLRIHSVSDPSHHKVPPVVEVNCSGNLPDAN